jgi:hypothetical protein
VNVKKVYLAGKITGDKDYANKFNRWAKILRGGGDIVINPAVLPKDMEHGEYLHICFAMIDVADEVYFLPDWQESRGAMMERDYCIENGKSVVDV